MIDIVFQLLLFFALSTSFSSQSLPVNLPEASTAQLERPNAVILTVMEDGRYFLGDREIASGNLVVELGAALGGADRRIVRIEADERADVGPSVRALDAARAAGAEAATIATTTAPGTPPQ